MRFHDHFSERATAYARSRPVYPAALARFLAASTRSPGRAHEVGCGSGQLTRQLATQFEHVCASDPSLPQLVNAVRDSRISYHCAVAEASALRDASCDLIVAAQAAHWFDIDSFYSEAVRVARPGAVIALVSYGVAEITPDIDKVTHHFHYDVLKTYWPPERHHVDAAYSTLPFPFEPIEAPVLEMACDWTLADMLAYVETQSAVRALEAADGKARVDAFQRDLAAVWGEAEQERPVHWPVTIKAGRIAKS